MTLTPRQMQILKFIGRFRDNNGYSPTMQEIAEELHLSKVTVFEHVEALVQKRLLSRQRRKARSLKLKGQAENVWRQWQDIDHSVAAAQSLPSSFPLLGTIAAGSPVEAIQDDQTLALDSMFSSNGPTFALRVRGDSMIDEQIRDGDYVLVEQCDSARDGQIVVAMLPDGETTLKKLYRQDGRFRLEPANNTFTPIYTDNLDIQGVVIGVVRRY